MRKQFIEVPLPLARHAGSRLLAGLKALLLAPLYLAAAHLAGGPGTAYHVRIQRRALRLLFAGRIGLGEAISLLAMPMDSTRYIEFDEVWRLARAGSFRRLLDVSSPRFVPLLLLESQPGATAVLLNPDSADRRDTERLARAMALDGRITFSGELIDRAGLAPGSFDLVTCVSVLEHIPEDAAALRAMWSLLAPGGRLLLTLPCMAQPREQYISHSEYGLLAPGDNGYTFWQRFYDPARLEAVVLAVTGAPRSVSVWGETQPGLFFRNATAKRLLGIHYPVWREPWMVAREYRRFESVAALPGEGVVMYEFVKAA